MQTGISNRPIKIIAGTALLVLIVANLLIYRSDICEEKKIPDALASWWLAKAYFAGTSSPDVVILGSSQLGPLLGADAYAFNREVDITDDHRSIVIEHQLSTSLKKDLRVFVGALPGAMISDRAVLSHALFVGKYKPKLVAVTLSPRDLIDRCFRSVGSTEAFTFFADYLDCPAELKDWLSKIRTINYKYGPMYNCDLDDKSPLALGEPFERIRPGEIVIRSGDGYSFNDNLAEYRLRYRMPASPQFALQMHYLDDLLAFLHDQDIKVVVFGLPLTTANRKLLPESFWSLYDQRISQACKKYNADWIDIDKDVKGFGDNEFMDGVHLNLIGGYRLANTIAFYIANKFQGKSFSERENTKLSML